MADFIPITTQEEFDSKIQERLARQKEIIEREMKEEYSKQFGDYDQLKELATNAKKEVDGLKSELEALTNQNKDYENQVQGLNQKVSSYETEHMKIKIALEKGLPYDLASRLVGDDEKSLLADADRLSNLIGQTKPSAPGKDIEPNVPTNSIDGALRQVVTNLNTKGE